jgi:hypothetical protein
LKPVEIHPQVLQGITEIESKVQGDLIIPASAGVEFPANRPNELSQPSFNTHMHIFIFGLPLMTACANVLPNGQESSNDGFAFSLGQDFSPL